MFELTVGPDRDVVTYDDGDWTGDTAASTRLVVDQAAAEPVMATANGPALPVDWSDERWLCLHAVAALFDAGLGPVTVTQAPEWGDLAEVPEGAIP